MNSLASVEVIMQQLDLASLLQLARCGRRRRLDADHGRVEASTTDTART
jgi:hypothetical protein